MPRAARRASSCAAALVVSVLGSAAAQPPPAGEPAVEISVAPADARRELPSELEVRVGGRVVEGVERLDPGAADPPRVVLYLDYSSARPLSVQALSTELVAQTGALAEIPGLEIVEADPEPRGVPAWRGAGELEQFASRLALRGVEDDQIAALRREFLAGIEEAGAAAEESAVDDGAEVSSGAPGAASPQELAEQAHRLELEHRRARQDALLAWIAAQGRGPGRRLLLLLDDNLGLDGEDFYRSRAGAAAPAALSAQGSAMLDELAMVLASYGWTLMPLLHEPPGDGGRLRYDPNAQTPVGFRLGLGRRADDSGDAAVDLGLDRRRSAAVDSMVRRTGGERVSDFTQLGERIAAFAARPVLRVPTHGLRPGEPAPIEVRGGGGAALAAPELIAIGTPAPIAALRARRALAGESVEGGLTVRSAIEFDPAALEQAPSRYEARVDLAGLRRRAGALERASFRVTLAVHLETDDVLLKQDVVRDAAVAAADEWVHEGTFRLPPETDGAVVLVELLETGDWGESFAGFVRRRAGAAAAAGGLDRSPGELAPGPRMVRLVPPERDVVYGRLRIRAEVDPRVRRLVYLLDGKRVETRRRAPWDASLELGADPRQRLLVAIAYGAGDLELGRDGLLLNDAARGFAVRIVEPREGRRVGPVDVEAELSLPQGVALDRLEFYWQDELVATVRRPPFRQRLFIPVAGQPGFVRVAAHLADGRVAEDVVLMNADRFAEQVTVNLVELFVVVTDRAGNPVSDLEVGDFAILEEGRPQRIETFARAGDLPITVGLALDSSLSLFLKMPALKTAATAFVDGLVPHRDQAFLVGFSSQPTVVRATTGDLPNVVSGIHSLEPSGNTALWEGVVLSLLQLQEIAGRKALVVFWDGDDEDEDFSFTTAFKLAQKVGVPVYLIVMNNALARSGPEGFTTKHRAERLERISRAGGGKVFYVSTEADLGEIFDAIRDELRAHYLLTYYPEPAPAQAEEERSGGAVPRWRPIEVKVERPGLTARTLAGYENL